MSSDIRNQEEQLKQKVKDTKVVISKVYGVKIVCSLKEYGPEICDEYFLRMDTILNDLDHRFKRIKMIVLARDSKKTDAQGIIIINMKRRFDHSIKRYLKKNDR